MSNDLSLTLETIIKNRRSIRSFNSKVPEVAQIERIINAGVFAPFAAAAVSGRENYRKFFVIKKESVNHKKLEIIINNHIQKSLKKLNSWPLKLLGVSRKLSSLIKRLENFKFPDAPYIIIIAELNGIPAVAPQALAHTAENMWLFATSENLGFQLLSVFESMKKSRELCEFLKLKKGEYSFLGCAIGFPTADINQAKRPNPKTLTTWL